MGKIIDLVGQKFGRLTVQSYSHKSKRAYWNCVCECGNLRKVDTTSLRGGNSKSCGCLLRDVTIERSTTHGRAKTPEYISWQAAITRCYNKLQKTYYRYGGRGITMCERWRNSFENFYADMGPKPTPKHSIERINNDGNYEPSNCKWATMKEQGRNTTKARLLTYNGMTMCINEWAEKLNINRGVIRYEANRGRFEKLAQKHLSE